MREGWGTRAAAAGREFKTRGLHQFVDEGFGDFGGDAYVLVDQGAWFQDGFGIVGWRGTGGNTTWVGRG